MAVPSKPVVTVQNIEDNQVTVVWSSPSDGGSPIIDWNIRQVNLDAGTQINTKVTTGSPLSGALVLFNLLAGTNYRVLISARNIDGFSDEGFIEFKTLGIIPPPPPPPELKIPDPPTMNPVTNITENSALVSWNPPLNDGGSPIISYRIVIQKGGVNFIDQVIGLNTSFQVTGLDPNTEYQALVSVRNAIGGTSFSAATILFTTIGVSLPNVFTFDIIVTLPDGTTATIFNNALTEPDLNFLKNEPLPIQIINEQISTLSSGQNIQTVLDEIDALLTAPPNDSIDATMVEQTIDPFKIENERLTGSILYSVTSTFNAFWFDKEIKSVVQIKTPSGVSLVLKQNS